MYVLQALGDDPIAAQYLRSGKFARIEPIRRVNRVESASSRSEGIHEARHHPAMLSRCVRRMVTSCRGIRRQPTYNSRQYRTTE